MLPPQRVSAALTPSCRRRGCGTAAREAKTGDKPPSPAVRIRPGTRPPCRADFSRLRDAIADARLYGNVKLETALQPRGGRTAEHEIHRLRLNPPHTHGRGVKRTNGTGFLPFASQARL